MKSTLRATIVESRGPEARQPGTPMVGAGSLVAYRRNSEGKRELCEAISVRTYWSSRGDGTQPVRACVWVRNARPGEDWISGRGSASGCGYHKESQAIADAVSNAGIRLFGSPARYGRDSRPRSESFHFGGTGNSAYAEIFETIARARGFTGPFLWVSHGL